MYWNSDESFPRAPSGWSAWRPPFGRRLEGESAVQRATWQWHPLDPLLISVPGSERMLPPICFSGVASRLQMRMIGQYRLLLLMMVCMMLGFAFAGVQADDAFFIKASVAMLLLLVFVGLQYVFLFRDMTRLRLYSRFCSWCYLQPRAQAVAIATLMILAGGLQYYLQARAGSLFGVVERYGLVFEDATRQPWRYLTGPFLHAGPAHWLANFSLLVVAAGLAFPLGRSRAIWSVFLAGVFVPAYCLTFLPHWVGSDAFLGVSGGVFALYGWIAGVSLRNPRTFPFGLWWLLAYFAVATAAISSLLDPRASWFAHTLGLLIGFVAGMSNFDVKLDFGGLVRQADGARAD